MATETISLARGAPSADLLPVEAVRTATAKVLESDWEAALSYGGGGGHPGLQEWIADRHGVPTNRVMTVNGSLHGATMLFGQGLASGDVVAVEDPSYDRTLLLLEQVGAHMLTVPLDAEGMQVDNLAEQLDGGATPKLCHVIPTHHNPGGCTLSANRRRQLVDLAAEHRFAIFEDDPYADVNFEGEPPETLLSMDTADAVVYSCSFSKTVAPGMRVGYLVGPAQIISQLSKRANEQYISPNMLAQGVVSELCHSGALDRNIASVCEALEQRCSAMCDAVEQLLPDAHFVQPEGGYFLWLTFPDDVDAARLADKAAEEGVQVIKGTDFSPNAGGSSLRLSFAPVTATEAEEGVRRLASALDAVRNGA
ncbi:MAG: PLP-dependent aminotransferase family protein [Solirubrobacterales bacterium]